MRDIDQPAIEKQLQALEAPTPSQPELTPAEIWTENVLREGISVVESLLHLAPALDRQKLRQLLRNASKAKETAELNKIRQQLHAYISGYL